jgi:hypothetical protein
MKLSKLLISFFRLLLLAEVICFGVIIPKYNNLENRISNAYQNILINLNKAEVKSYTITDQELRYDMLRIKRTKTKKLF